MTEKAEATEKDLKDLGAPPARLPACEICGDPKLPYGATAWALGQCYRGTGQLDWDSRGTVTCYRIGYLRMKERADAAEARAEDEFRTADDGFHATFKQIQRCQEAGHVKGGGCCGPCILKATRAWKFATATDPALRRVDGERAAQAAPSVTDLTPSLTREREENQRLKRALRAAQAERDEARQLACDLESHVRDAERCYEREKERLAVAFGAIRWACGDEPLPDGRWFDPEAFGLRGKIPPYWWRRFLRLYSGLESAPIRALTSGASAAQPPSSPSKDTE